MFRPALLWIAVLAAGCDMGAAVDAADPGAAARKRSNGKTTNATQDFRDLADIASGVAACSNTGSNAWTETGCYNLELPPKPSILRSLVVAHPNHQGADNVVSFPEAQDAAGGQTLQLGTRSSVDGRLQILEYGHEPLLGLVYPENLTRGWQTQPDTLVQPPTARAHVRPWMMMSTNTALSPAQLDHFDPQWSTYPHYPFSAGSDLCNRGKESEPYACQARAAASDPLRDGTCWDISIVTAMMGTINGPVREFRSNRLTVFAENAEVIPSPGGDIMASGAPLPRDVFVYPTAGVERFGGGWIGGKRVLPAYDDFDAEAAYLAQRGSDQTDRWIASYNLDRNQCAGFETNPSQSPRWCWYFADQETSGDVSSPDEGSTKAFIPIELSTTADGKVIVGHDARGPAGLGIFYAHTDQACDASGWSRAKPLSRAHQDPDVHGTYGFAEYPLTMPDGLQVPAGRAVAGAYPWIDRAGSNIFIGGHVPSYGWRECMFGTAQGQDCSLLVPPTDINVLNAKAPKVWGLWTRGKMTYLDGVLEGVDHTAHRQALRPFYMALYKDADWVKIRPGNNTDFFSYEHLFNHYDALAPVMPGDVVWTVTAGNNRVHGEVVFDDYMMKGSRIVAPMNPRIKGVRSLDTYDNVLYDTLSFRRENGMSIDPTKPNVSGGERFTGTNIFLQNNAPLGAANLPTLEVRGGAFIPPANSGVVGRAIFLDGDNDRVEVNNVDFAPSFYLGMWVEPHDSAERTLFTLSDGSRLNISSSELTLWLNDGVQNGNCYSGTSSTRWSGLALPPNQWHHIALAVKQSVKSGVAEVHLFVDGQHLGGRSIQHASAWMDGSFVVGSNEDHCIDNTHYSPIRAWIDELKLFELDANAIYSTWLLEVACNRALGSLDAQGQCEQIDFAAPEVLDQHGVGSGLEFAKSTYDDVNCAIDMHRIGDPACGRDAALGVSDLDPMQPRPYQGGNDFCLQCHETGGPKATVDDWTRFDMSTDALSAGIMAMHEDPRRQPAQPPTLHDHDIFNGHHTVIHDDAARIERCDLVDNDDDSGNTIDHGCGTCPQGTAEVGRVAFEGGRVPLFRDPEGTWNPRGEPSIASGSPSEAAAFCQTAFKASSAMLSLPMSVDVKPFVDASYDLHPATGGAEYVCCGTPPAVPPPVPVTVDVEVLPMAHDDTSTVMSVQCASDGIALAGAAWTHTLSCDPGPVTVSCSSELPLLWARVGDGPDFRLGTCTQTSCSGTLDVGESDVKVECRYYQTRSGSIDELRQ